MKKRFFAVFILIFILLCGCSEGEAMETESETEEKMITEIMNGKDTLDIYYTNDIVRDAADPFILEYDGIYYLYSTGGMQFTVRKSKDLKQWQNVSAPILRLSETGWASQNGWAPEVYEYNGKFYFIYSAQAANGVHSIDIAVCDTPDGKFKPLKRGDPFFSPGYSVIDGSLFFDDDGKIYMYYSKDCSTNVLNGKNTSQTYGIELKSDLSGTVGEPVLISTPEQNWELVSGNYIWNEGPVVFKKDGTYYLLYSANYYNSEHYAVGYAYSDSPLKKF
ncbi:MAG: hypothetical protein E7623_07885, partial [Ruminococcaceae bacterium]|nr:hypothetical protein [Oscillospiraceae bacterium]